MAPRSERHPDLHRRRVPSRSAILAIRTIAPIRAVAASGGSIRIDRAHAATYAICSIGAVQAAGAVTTGEVRYEVVVVPERNIELRAKSRLARNRDNDMPHLPIADPGVTRKGYNSFFTDRHDTRRNRKVLPQNLSLAFPFRNQYLSVRLGQFHDQRRFLSRRNTRVIRQAGLYGRDR